MTDERMSKTKEAFYAGWRAGAATEGMDQEDPRWSNPDLEWAEFEAKIAKRPSPQQLIERVTVVLCLLAILAFVIAPYAYGLLRVAK